MSSFTDRGYPISKILDMVDSLKVAGADVEKLMLYIENGVLYILDSERVAFDD